MGLAMANVLDPKSQEQISLVGRFESVTENSDISGPMEDT
ncbi:MAG: hypothetical protein Ct9H300mP28_25420 [Pseudomonadota bacterium]|nr:MAG: hypothetical protein Ct9H300mP28_25420 [Pseudomonadota bacterium]